MIKLIKINLTFLVDNKYISFLPKPSRTDGGGDERDIYIYSRKRSPVCKSGYPWAHPWRSPPLIQTLLVGMSYPM